MPSLEDLQRTLRRLHWERGLRAGIAVLAAMIVCQRLGRPMGWAALGGFESILVDNGGPYRSRLTTILTLLGGGAAGLFLVAVTATPWWLVVVATALFCFAITYGRALSSQLASTSVIILVIYFVGLGEEPHTLRVAIESSVAFVLGGLWAAAVSLFLWPLDPFRPARQAVADCYEQLAAFTAGLHVTEHSSEERDRQRQAMHTLSRTLRSRIEAARDIIGTTGARGTARTIRARSLTVLLETVDILFASTIRWTELSEQLTEEAAKQELHDAVRWLAAAERVIVSSLRQRPADAGSSFAREGSHTVEYLRKRESRLQGIMPSGSPLLQHLLADERDALLNIEVAFDAVRAIWSGVEHRADRAGGLPVEHRSMLASTSAEPVLRSGWQAMVEAARSNWTTQSLMMRHALRVLVVSVADVFIMRLAHVSHGAWLGMTSIIVLQPYGSGTLRRSAERVGGTVAGGVFAAVLAVLLHNRAELIAAITITSVLTLATYAVNYAWFCFFLTPTFVLMSMPHFGDWRLAGVRISMTAIGASLAVLAMALLWPERGRTHLGRMLARGARADAEYLRATLAFWSASASTATRIEADRRVLAPARRAVGLAINDAEEMLDRLMLEPRVGRSSGPRWEEALTFVTYLRRMSRAATMLATVGASGQGAIERMESIVLRLDAVAEALIAGAPLATAVPHTQTAHEVEDLAESQMLRLERQVGVLERVTAQLAV